LTPPPPTNNPHTIAYIHYLEQLSLCLSSRGRTRCSN